MCIRDSIIPDTAKEKPLQGEVVAIGNGTKDEEMVLHVGDQEMCIRDRDNFAAAYEVGKLLGKKLRTDDKVAIIEGMAVPDNARQRQRGFIKAIEEKGLRLVASEPADWETEKAAEVFQAMCCLLYTSRCV